MWQCNIYIHIYLFFLKGDYAFAILLEFRNSVEWRLRFQTKVYFFSLNCFISMYFSLYFSVLCGFSSVWLCCTLRSWYREICIRFRTVSLRLEDNYASKCSSDKFPYTKIYVTMYGKLPELHCNVSMFSNCGENVWKTRGQICPIIVLLFMTFSPLLESNDTLQCTSDNFPCMVTYTL